MTTTVTAKIQLRKGTAAAWTSANPVLLSGEVGFETDTLKLKIGDGTTAWISLAYHHDPDLAATYAAIAHTHSGVYEPADATLLKQADVDDTPVNGVTTAPVSSNWAYDHAALSTAHGISSFGATLVDDADAATARGTLGLGTAAVAATGDFATASHDHAATYAPLAKGVTNGDSHDHNGGDGAQIAYSTLSGLPTLGTAAAQNTGAFEAAGAISTHAAVTSSVHGISSFGATLVDDTDAATARSTLGLGTAATTAATAYEPAATVEINAALADDDTFPTYDTSATAQKKSLMSRLWTYIASKLSSYSGDLTANSFSLSGNISAAAWTTAGIRHKNIAATLTDTSSSGTVATAYTDVFGGNTIAASNSVTFTNYGTAYLATPVAGANVTITNAYSLITQGPIRIGSLPAVTGDNVQSVVKLTQAAYDALTPKVSTTLYVVTG